MDQTLNALARAAYADSAARVDTESAENEAAAAEAFLAVARRCANDVLGEASEVLPWRYTPWAESAEGTEEAVAALAPGRAHSFALHYTCTEDSVVFALAATCVGCGCRTLTPVISLQHLGQLLEEADAQDEQHQADERPDDPGPLASVDALRSAAEHVAGFLQRMVARHPEAGLSVEFASAYGHHTGGRSGSLRLAARSADAVIEIAQSQGDAFAVTEQIEDRGPHVSRWVTAAYSTDDIELQVSGYSYLSDEDAATWRASQPQGAEGTDGGES
ncbi:hypothetical protein [Streptomyces sp. NPDC010273]|uniref:hypothetical protein n=1 Tax=Streptomyces sp. NPDC010273 TaxID=3364829 RepID=UPI0036EFD3AB